MRLTNKDDHSLSVAIWLSVDYYDHNRHPGKLHMSATGLLKSIRQIILGMRQRAIKNELFEFDISNSIPNRMGTAIHAGIEKAWKNEEKRTNALLNLGYDEATVSRIKVNPTKKELETNPSIIPVYIEQRFNKELDGFIIDGEADFIGHGILEDFKSTGVYGYMKGNNDKTHIQQASIYRWLAPDIITADYVKIQYIFTDWSKLDSIIKKKVGYPQSRILTKKLNLMSLQETEEFIKDKLKQIKLYTKAPESELPKCNKEELWQSDTVYKYYSKPSNKKAQKVFKNSTEAYGHLINKGSVGKIVEVKGKVRRCAYCDGFDLCNQKNIYIANGSFIPSK